MNCPSGGPSQRGKCPFYIVADDPLSADASVKHCVDAITANNDRLQGHKEDFYQIAYLALLEALPEYNPSHPSGASLITFVKSRVCTHLWQERSRVLSHIPFPTEPSDCSGCAGGCCQNPLVSELTRQACSQESMEDQVIRRIEVENLRKYYPLLTRRLSEKEKSVLQLKFFEEKSSVEISKTLGVSEGRVSQLTQTALEKVGKAYFLLSFAKDRNPYI